MHFTTIFLALAASVAAQPHHKRQQGHKHAAKHHEARAAAPVIEWVTEYEYTTEVVPVTKTIVSFLSLQCASTLLIRNLVGHTRVCATCTNHLYLVT